MAQATTVDFEREVENLLQDLIRIPSINPAFRRDDEPAEWFGEKALADYVADYLRRAGLDVELQEVEPGRPNVIALLEGRGTHGVSSSLSPGPGRRKKTLVWETHMDTVQVKGMTVDPFHPRVANGRIWGRGATDAKGSLAAMMAALHWLAAGTERPAADVVLVAAVDEEFRYRGVTHLLDSGFRADGGVVGEPTSCQIVTACKGCVRWRIEVQGRAAHTSRPHEGVNAVEGASQLILRLRDELGPRLAARAHPLVGPPTLCPSMIEGGVGVNTVPDRCFITFDRRVIPGEKPEEVLAEIEAICRQMRAEYPQWGIVMHPPFVVDIPMEVPPSAEVVKAAQRATRRELGYDDLVGVAYGCDASKMVDRGIPTIVFGPGSIQEAHSSDEYIEIEQLHKATRALRAIALEFGAEGTI